MGSYGRVVAPVAQALIALAYRSSTALFVTVRTALNSGRTDADAGGAVGAEHGTGNARKSRSSCDALTTTVFREPGK